MSMKGANIDTMNPYKRYNNTVTKRERRDHKDRVVHSRQPNAMAKMMATAPEPRVLRPVAPLAPDAEPVDDEPAPLELEVDVELLMALALKASKVLALVSSALMANTMPCAQWPV